MDERFTPTTGMIIPQLSDTYQMMQQRDCWSTYPMELCPKTWQGWKELEDLLSPSTMKDEIRLTRMLIQYCDTNDKKVLDELKEWFADMNELQRICMARSLSQRRSRDLASTANEFYQAVREYDAIPKLDFEFGF